MTVAAVLLCLSQVLRFASLKFSPVSVAHSLLWIGVVFVLLFSWIANRRIDVFSWRMVTGIVLVLGGVFLIY